MFARLLEWDSDFFGCRIARVENQQMSAAEGAETVAWADANDIDCLYHLLSADDAAGLRTAHSLGFRVVDFRMTLDTTIDAGSGFELPVGVDLHVHDPGEVAELARIASTSHRNTRFYADGNFDRDRCDELYATWIAKSCASDDCVVLVPTIGDRPCGYITCEMSEESGSIGLIAVDDHARGRGIAGCLVAGSLERFASAGISKVSVVTQGANVGAVRLYERAGFVLQTAEIWLHRWRAAGPTVVLN